MRLSAPVGGGALIFPAEFGRCWSEFLVHIHEAHIEHMVLLAQDHGHRGVWHTGSARDMFFQRNNSLLPSSKIWVDFYRENQILRSVLDAKPKIYPCLSPLIGSVRNLVIFFSFGASISNSKQILMFKQTVLFS